MAHCTARVTPAHQQNGAHRFQRAPRLGGERLFGGDRGRLGSARLGRLGGLAFGIDRNPPRLQRIGELAHQIDAEQAILQARGVDADVIGQAKAPLKAALRYAPMQKLAGVFATRGAPARDKQGIGAKLDREIRFGKAGHSQLDAKRIFAGLLNIEGGVTGRGIEPQPLIDQAGNAIEANKRAIEGREIQSVHIMSFTSNMHASTARRGGDDIRSNMAADDVAKPRLGVSLTPDVHMDLVFQGIRRGASSLSKSARQQRPSRRRTYEFRSSAAQAARLQGGEKSVRPKEIIMQRSVFALSALSAVVLLAACAGDNVPDLQQAPPVASLDAAAKEPGGKVDGAALSAVLAGAHRPPGESARDSQRHPLETLTFFGVRSSDVVVEITPGGGWYTQVLAPYVAKGGGRYIAALGDPAASERAAQALAAYKAKFSDPAIYGQIDTSVFSRTGAPACAPGSADVVLTFRNVHNWMGGGFNDEAFQAFYGCLKPGGVLGVIEHRLDEGATQDPQAGTGYVKESVVIGAATRAGFQLAGRSEINANAKDTKDHPFGVWTLPPVSRTSAFGQPDNPAFDRSKYDAIGESDRMTLKFVKAS